MPCVYKPNYQPYDFLNLSPAYSWGIGRAAGYIHFDQNEFSMLEGESHITWDINFKDKIAGKLNPNPNRLIAENRNHVFHNNILRGSKFLANPVQLFNGAVYNEKIQDNNSAVALTQQAGQGLMFYWDDFKGDYGVMKNGDTLTISVEVRTNNKEVNLVEAVRLKATPNFTPEFQVTSQTVGDGFTRIIFRTVVTDIDWKAPEGWSDTWGTVNPAIPSVTKNGRTWDKDNLIGVVQNIDNVQLEFARPMVSLEGSTTYQEAAADYVRTNIFSWTGMQNKKRLLNAAFVSSKFAKEWANPTFQAVPVNSVRQSTATFMVMKFTKTPFTLTPSEGMYGKVCWYSDKTEASYISFNQFSSEDGKYGGELSLMEVPTNAKYFRLHVTANSQQSVDFVMGFNDSSYIDNTTQNAELTQSMYDGVAEQLDSKVARVYADNYYERVKVDYRIDLLAEISKALPNAFDGLTLEQKVTRLKTIAYSMDLTMTARGGDDDNVVHWHMKNNNNVAGSIYDFRRDELTSYTHRSTWQDWIQDDGTLYGYVYTEAPKPSNKTRAWVEIDYFNIRMSIVAKNEEIEAWNFQSQNPKYNLETVGELMMRTEDNMQNSSVQVTQGFDIYGIVSNDYPEFFGDCYTYEDCIAKLNDRIESFTFVVESNIPDPDIGGEGYVNYVVEASEPVRDYMTKYNKNTQHIITVTNGLSKFVKENGYVYIGCERPPEDRNAELGSTANVTFRLLMDRKYDNDKRIFRLNKKKQPWYLFVRDIQRSVLPPKVNNLVDMNRGRNRYSYGQTESARYITLKCFIKAPSEVELDRLAEDLADYLDVGETVLQLYDAPERVYKVLLDGETSITQNLFMGEVELSFILLDNYAIGNEIVEEDTFNAPDGSIPYIELNNAGTAETYPQYVLDFTADTGYVDLIGEEDSANISIGRRKDTGASESTKNLRPREFYSSFNSNNGVPWVNMDAATLPNIEDKAADIQGTLVWNGGMGYMKSWNYGKGTYWHGNGKYAPLNHNVTNFVAEFSTALLGTPKASMLGGLWLIFYDAAKTPLAKVKLGNRPQDGHLDSYITAAADNKPRFLINQGTSKLWDNFQGKVIVERKDNRWKLTVGQFKNRQYSPAPEASFDFGSAMLKSVKATSWVDLGDTTWDKDVAYVGVFTGTYGTRPKLSHISARRLIVWENLDADLTSYEEEPILFHSGDQVVIDSAKGQTFLNGVATPRLVDPSTDWFSVKKGRNIIGVNNFQGKITTVYNERFK